LPEVGAHRRGGETAAAASISGSADVPPMAGGRQDAEGVKRGTRGLLEKERGGGGKAAVMGTTHFL
jgi:hypothetical protein